MQGTFSTAYSTSKWALNGLSACVAVNLADWGIRSNVICPGFIRNTNLTKAMESPQGTRDNPLTDAALIGRAGETIELAQAALFFASDESSYITGTILPVDGGLHDTGVSGLMRKKMSQIQEEKK
jgi:NAD(P)-dependent dehydrogenase (short-subunit alcohol dehydrogenase family)